MGEPEVVALGEDACAAAGDEVVEPGGKEGHALAEVGEVEVYAGKSVGGGEGGVVGAMGGEWCVVVADGHWSHCCRHPEVVQCVSVVTGI